MGHVEKAGLDGSGRVGIEGDGDVGKLTDEGLAAAGSEVSSGGDKISEGIDSDLRFSADIAAARVDRAVMAVRCICGARFTTERKRKALRCTECGYLLARCRSGSDWQACKGVRWQLSTG